MREHFQKQPLTVYHNKFERDLPKLVPGDCGPGFLQDFDLPGLSPLHGLGSPGAEQRRRSGIAHRQGPVANESGQTRLAWLLTCLDDPPFAMVEARRAPEPRWVGAQRVPEGRAADSGKDHCSAPAAGSIDKSPEQPGEAERQGEEAESHKRQCGGGGHRLSSLDWFLPQLFPSGLDDSLSASTLALVVQRFLLRAKTPLSSFIHNSLAQSIFRARLAELHRSLAMSFAPTYGTSAFQVGQQAQGAVDRQAPTQVGYSPYSCSV